MNKQDFMKLGGKEWVKGDMERVYINADTFNKLADVNLSDRNNRFFYDCTTNALMRSHKGKKPTVEAQY